MKNSNAMKQEAVVPTVADIKKMIATNPEGLATCLHAILARQVRMDAGIGLLLGRADKPSSGAFDPTMASVKELTKSMGAADREIGDPTEAVKRDKNVVGPLQVKFEIHDEVYACYYDFDQPDSSSVMEGVVKGRAKERYFLEVQEADESISELEVDREDVFERSTRGQAAAQAHLKKILDEHVEEKRAKQVRAARLTVALLGDDQVTGEKLAVFGGKAVATMARIVGLNMFADLAGVKGQARFDLLAETALKFQTRKGSAKVLHSAEDVLLDDVNRLAKKAKAAKKATESARNAPVEPGTFTYGDVPAGTLQTESAERVMTGHWVQMVEGLAVVRRIADNDRVSLEYMASGDRTVIKGMSLVRIGERRRVPVWTVRDSAIHREALASNVVATPPPPKTTTKATSSSTFTSKMADIANGVVPAVVVAPVVVEKSQESPQAVLESVLPRPGQFIRLNGKLWTVKTAIDRATTKNVTLTRTGQADMVVPVNFRYVKGNVFEVAS